MTRTMVHRRQGSFYDLLGVSPDATPEQIRRAFLDRAQRFHPDLNHHDPLSETQFKQIRRVYEVLSDPLQRARYDDVPERFCLDDAGNDSYDRSTIVTEPSHTVNSTPAGTRPPFSDRFPPSFGRPWNMRDKSKGGWQVLLAASTGGLLLLAILTWQLSRPSRHDQSNASVHQPGAARKTSQSSDTGQHPHSIAPSRPLSRATDLTSRPNQSTKKPRPNAFAPKPKPKSNRDSRPLRDDRAVGSTPELAPFDGIGFVPGPVPTPYDSPQDWWASQTLLPQAELWPPPPTIPSWPEAGPVFSPIDTTPPIVTTGPSLRPPTSWGDTPVNRGRLRQESYLPPPSIARLPAPPLEMPATLDAVSRENLWTGFRALVNPTLEAPLTYPTGLPSGLATMALGVDPTTPTLPTADLSPAGSGILMPLPGWHSTATPTLPGRPPLPGGPFPGPTPFSIGLPTGTVPPSSWP